MQNTRLAISRYFGEIFNQLGGFKFVETLVVNFVKPADNKQNLESVFINSSPQTVINSTDFLPTLNMSQQQIMAGIRLVPSRYLCVFGGERRLGLG